jgi:enamine deaminase RidA (YjgF/YER057c/UK114 family)
MSNPPTVHTPGSPYSLGVETTGSVRWLTLAGQVGLDKSGKLASEARGQIEQAFANLIAVLEANDMSAKDLVKTTAFLTRREDLAAYREIRGKYIGPEAASTLLFVAGLAHPDMVFEIEGQAAK